MDKTERLNLVLTPEEFERLASLADANTGGNKSLLVRTLINLVFMNPGAVGLYAPQNGITQAEMLRGLITEWV